MSPIRKNPGARAIAKTDQDVEDGQLNGRERRSEAWGKSMKGMAELSFFSKAARAKAGARRDTNRVSFGKRGRNGWKSRWLVMAKGLKPGYQ